MKQPIAIAYYAHATEPEPVETDTRPGYYYVSMRNGSKEAALLGPFREYQQALDWVVACQGPANTLDEWSDFYEFGTRHVPLEVEPARLPTGRLNDVFPDAPGLIKDHKQKGTPKGAEEPK